MSLSGITQAELARACNVKPPSIHGWLNNKSKFLRGENLLMAAAALKVNPDWLATGDGEMKINHLSIQSSQAQLARMVATTGPSLGETLKYLSGYLGSLDARSRARVGQLLKDLAEEPDTHERITAIFQAEIDSGKRKAA